MSFDRSQPSHPSDLDGRSTSTRQFLTTVFSGKPDTSLILIWTRSDKHSRWFTFASDAADAVTALEHDDVYVGVGLSPCDNGPYRRCRSGEISAIVAVTTDIDILHPVHAQTSLPPTRADAERLIAGCQLPPSIVVNSGHGQHSWWLLDEPFIIDSPATRARAEALFHGWNRLVQGNAHKHGWRVDSTFDLARLLRIPGTRNHRDPEVSVPVELVSIEPSRRYAIDEVEQVIREALQTEANSLQRSPAIIELTRVNAVPLEPSALVVAPDASPPQDAFADLMAREPSFALTWHHQRADLADTSLSGHDMSLADLAVRNGWSDQEVADLLIAHRRQHGGAPEPESYYRLTLSRARAALGGPRRATSSADGLVKRLADALSATEAFAHDGAGGLFHYDQGVYQPMGEDHVKRAVQTTLETWDDSSKWRRSLGSDVAEYLRLRSPRLWNNPPPDEVNLTNGILDVNTSVLRPHDPAFLSTVRVPVAFDASATCPAWDQFVSDILPPTVHALVWELAADLVTPVRDDQRAILLYGEGSNGKSRLLAGLTAMVGQENVSAVSLQQLEHSRFFAAELAGKLANISADLPSTVLASSSLFRSITGGDLISVERKFGAPFKVKLFARLLFASNALPSSRDASPAFFRRWLIIPFERQFDGDARIAPHVLDRQLADSAELSGLLNRALAALPGLRRNGFSESLATRSMHQTFERATDPLSLWLEDTVVGDPAGVVGKAALRDAYRVACLKEGRTAPTPEPFGRAVKRLMPHLQTVQRTVDGRAKQPCYLGIRFRDSGES